MPLTFPPFEFHISRAARQRYQFEGSLYATSGNVIFADFRAARVFAQKMNAGRDLLRFPEQAARAGQLNAMGLVDEILHFVADKYRQEAAPRAMQDALQSLTVELGEEAVMEALRRFTLEFPPLKVHRGEVSAEDYLAGRTRLESGAWLPNACIALEEMLMLWLANQNPAFAPYGELFDDTPLQHNTQYPQIILALHAFFESQPHYGPDGDNLVDMLRAPAIAVPHSLPGQLEYIRTRWGYLLSDLLFRLLSSLDFIKEDEKAAFSGAGRASVPDFSGLESEAERFSPDREWMPNLVLIAKNVYVWLDQLSKKYRQPIDHLDLIPDEELEALRRWGFTGLWLIGLWERSPASQRIKQMRGNPEAVASAYSLFEYAIAADLGGEAAYQRLKERAWLHGIRLASDMVPNHMGIDSRWVIEHPDWFIALDRSPFPVYTYNGPNLSWDGRVGIYLEDHYYDDSDAAVVFKRVDQWSGEVKYIYHGNDGTSMPWNDTAQLNFLNPEVREAVIQAILHVARQFPIIRFDAAMTLAKRHFQRLWFPEPGSGGDIPSRAEHGMTREQFNATFPNEFWREVVDRVAQEAPDTLLLAEAFWLMEGYFVRTLGMHRVYNSAFMNMLRDERNQEYRQAIKNTLEFDPEILKRYVNFMNNPDERTAVDQFGKEDKYFGICILMATLPGLPMFGHGQIEGFTEKYGMEYRRAYWDEQPDGDLVTRHEREIFPLLRRRYLFAEANAFLLYDFFTPDGAVNEDVYAYSNRAGEERGLVVYHNRFASARGWIRQSAAYSSRDDGGDGRRLLRKNLAEGLGLRDDPNCFTTFRDALSGMEYIRNNRTLHEQGLYVELDAYRCHVFLDFRQVEDNEWCHLSQLAAWLKGRGVTSLDQALREMLLQPLHHAYRELVNAGQLRYLIDNRQARRDAGGEPEVEDGARRVAALDEVEAKATSLLEEIKAFTGQEGDSASLAAEIREDVRSILDLEAPAQSATSTWSDYLRLGEWVEAGEAVIWGPALIWGVTRKLGKLCAPIGASPTLGAQASAACYQDYLLAGVVAEALRNLGMEASTASRHADLMPLLFRYQGWSDGLAGEHPDAPDREHARQLLAGWLENGDVHRYLGVNRHQEATWFNKETFEELLWWLTLIESLQAPDRAEAITVLIQAMLEAEAQSGYQVEKLLAALE